MERKIHDYFETETMPDDLSRQIEETLTVPARKPSRSRWVRAAAIAASLVLVLMVVFSGQVTTTFAEFYDFIIHTQKPEVTEPLGQVDEDTIVSYGGIVEHRSDDGVSSGSFSPGLNDPVTVEDGRLYFIANGEHIDITDLCSEEEAYIYVLQDSTGVRHYFAVGGTPDDYGYEIYIQIPGEEADGWTGGASAGHRTAASGWETRAWVYDAKEKIGHPWPID